MSASSSVREPVVQAEIVRPRPVHQRNEAHLTPRPQRHHVAQSQVQVPPPVYRQPRQPQVSAQQPSRVDSQIQTYFSSASNMIPKEISRSLDGSKTVTVQTKKLFEYCELSLKKLEDKEVLLEQKFESKIHSLKFELKAKDIESEKLRQQVEDLQVLVKLLEKKSLRA
jgi:hypothetical protein